MHDNNRKYAKCLEDFEEGKNILEKDKIYFVEEFTDSYYVGENLFVAKHYFEKLNVRELTTMIVERDREITHLKPRAEKYDEIKKLLGIKDLERSGHTHY